MLFPKSSIVPPGGFHYVERHAGTEIKLQAESVDTLAAVIEKYRLNNGFPLGNPRQDVVNYICSNWPHFCTEQDQGSFIEGRPPGPQAALAIRAAAWVTRLWNIGANNFVKQDEAERRAAICLKCPMNQDFRAGGCSSCVQGTDRLAYVWLAGRKIKDGPAYKACRATGAHLQAAVFANQSPDMSGEEMSRLDSACWRLPQPAE